VATKIQLEIEIDPEGNVHVVTHGLHGESCVHETESLERALGTVRAREKTSEYYGTAAGVRSQTGTKR
jgi:DUF2997 family protein